MSSEAKQYAARNRQGSGWFSHDSAADTTTPPAAKPSSPECKSDSIKEQSASTQTSERVQMIKPVSNSNDWYKYDSTESTAKLPDSKQGQHKQEEIEVAAPKVDVETDDPIAVTPSEVDSDANQNLKHSKAGETGSWFSHDNPNAADAVPHHGASKELSANAARMRGESANWFTHDQSSGEPATAAHCTKGRQYKQNTDNMHGIFHHGGQ